ncbi:MAG: branched-chain amino acid ABC transporter permease [Acidobacteriia bacterium]|nr:branched-chain amino acid ABC transporter permease [Terriglobia bacterium]
MTLVDFANLLVAAVLLAGIYAVMSVGMTVIYGVMKIVNLAHAGFMMLGAYFAMELFERLHLDPIVAALAVFPIMVVVGIAVYYLLVRWLPQSDKPTLPSLLLMFGLWLVLQNLGYVFWGNEDRSIFTPRTFDVIHAGPIILPTIRVYVFAAGAGCVLLLEGLLNWTWFGRALRALVQNRYAGQIVGVDDQKIAALTFGLGIGFAGLAGALLASLYSFNPDFGRPFLIRAFVIIVLGGLESVSGVAIGALVLALVESFAIIWLPAGYQLAVSFGMLVVVLIVLPGGIASLIGRVRRLA